MVKLMGRHFIVSTKNLTSSLKTEEVESCYICHRDMSLIGQKLPKANYVVFGKSIFDSKNSGEKIVAFKPITIETDRSKEGYYVEFAKEIPKSGDYYLMYKIGDTDKQNKSSQPLIEKHYANHVPVDSEGNILDFESIAEKSIWSKEENYIRKSYGSDLLGVLKVDIDILA